MPEIICPLCEGVKSILLCSHCNNTGVITQKPFETKELRRQWLERHRTRELLDLLRYARYSGYYDPWYDDFNIPIEEIKEVLATREHIPNKKEGRKIRQEKAKKNKGQKKSRGYRR